MTVRRGLAFVVVATMVGMAVEVLLLPSAAESPAPPGGGALRATAAMHEARAAHSATALADGTVLIVGGFTTQETQPAGAELFDPQRELFTEIPPPQVPRQSHTATRLRDGRVLLAGGLTGGGRHTDTGELYDPVARTFSRTGRMTEARAGHEAVLLDDGRVLLMGGTGTGWTFLATAEIYDPRTGRFAATGPLNEPRESHIAVRLREGRVLVAGGHRGRAEATVILRTAEIFDVATGRFSPTGEMVVRRHKHEAVALPDGRVLVFGGADERDSGGVYSSTEAFNPVTGQFRRGGPMRLGRYKHRGTSFLLPDGTLLLAGGAPQAETYDPVSGQSQVVPGKVRLAGQFSAAALLPGGRVLVTGGYGGGTGPRSSAWTFEPSTYNDRPGAR